MGSKHKRSTAESSRKAAKKKKNKDLQDSDENELGLPASPPVPQARVGQRNDGKSVATARTPSAPGTPRQPMILPVPHDVDESAGPGGPVGPGMSEFEQRLSRHYFRVSEDSSRLHQRVQDLDARVKALESGGGRVGEQRNEPKENFYLTLLGASGRVLTDLVDDWMLGLEPKGVLKTTDTACLPCFPTNLPYHYAYAVLSLEEETLLPLRRAMYAELGVRETDERNAIFKKYFEHRKSSKNRPDAIPELAKYEGLLQKYQRLRRQVKNDKIGKPALLIGVRPRQLC